MFSFLTTKRVTAQAVTLFAFPKRDDISMLVLTAYNDHAHSSVLDTRNGIAFVMCTCIERFKALLCSRIDLFAFEIVAVCFI